MSFYLYLFISFVLVLKMMGVCCDVVLCTGKRLKMLARTKIVTFINKGVIPAEGLIDAVEWRLFVPKARSQGRDINGSTLKSRAVLNK